MIEFAAVLVVAALVGLAVYALAALCIESGTTEEGGEPVDDATAVPDERDLDQHRQPRA